MYPSIDGVIADLRRPKRRATVEDICDILEDKGKELLFTFDMYDRDFPELRGEKKALLRKALSEVKEFLDQVYEED